ncbi:hypothetical protein MRX96_030640 [Rhipicephalus microplus]
MLERRLSESRRLSTRQCSALLDGSPGGLADGGERKPADRAEDRRVQRSSRTHRSALFRGLRQSGQSSHGMVSTAERKSRTDERQSDFAYTLQNFGGHKGIAKARQSVLMKTAREFRYFRAGKDIYFVLEKPRTCVFFGYDTQRPCCAGRLSWPTLARR